MAVPPPPPEIPPPADKAGLRTHLRRVRAAHVATLDRHARESAARVAAERIAAHVPPGASIALYHPLGDELDPLPLAILLAGSGARLALPHLADDGRTMTFRAWSPGDPLVRGRFGLMQPIGHEFAPDIVVTPLLGFDRRGGRIGQGAGCYDRAFASLPGAVRIGHGWSVQEIAAVPHDPWDAPLHAIATERDWITVSPLS